MNCKLDLINELVCKGNKLMQINMVLKEIKIRRIILYPN